MPLTERQAETKDAFIRIHGSWDASWQGILELDPEFLDAFTGLSAVPWTGTHLEPKTKALVCVAINASVTSLNLPGVRQNIRSALRLGATPAEVMEVLELASALGIHAMNVSLPLLSEVLSERQVRESDGELTAEQERLKSEFLTARGYWHPCWNDLLEYAPALFAAYTRFSSVPWRLGALTPKVKEFIYIALDATVTHLYTTGLKLHIENALDHGATPNEVVEVVALTSLVGIHAVTSGVPILLEEMSRFEQSHRRDDGTGPEQATEPAGRHSVTRAVQEPIHARRAADQASG